MLPAIVSGSYPISAMTRSIASLVFGLTAACLLTTRETLPTPTPASRATSRMVGLSITSFVRVERGFANFLSSDRQVFNQGKSVSPCGIYNIWCPIGQILILSLGYFKCRILFPDHFSRHFEPELRPKINDPE
jgi:hypothetical protein